MKWTREKRETKVKNDYFKVHEDTVTTPKGEMTYYLCESHDGVVVVPIKVKSDNIYFVLVEQYRYPLDRKILEFPGGLCNPGEPKEQAARRELKEETGYEAQQIKFVYSFENAPSRDRSKTAIYLAIVEDEPHQTKLDKWEEASELSIKEFSSDEVYKMITENEITDTISVAALSVVMMQSPKAKDYMGSLAKG